jgi:hypothetical protein
VFFVVFFALTLLGVDDKDARVFDPTSPIAQHFAPVKWYVLVHGFFGAIAMAVAAFQFSNPMRARYPPSASCTWICVCDQRRHFCPVGGYGGPEAVALAVAVRCKLCEFLWVGSNHSHRTLLYSHGQHRPASALDVNRCRE